MVAVLLDVFLLAFWPCDWPCASSGFLAFLWRFFGSSLDLLLAFLASGLLTFWYASLLAFVPSGMPRFWPLCLLACLASGLCAF
jgi:hypothetical protein